MSPYLAGALLAAASILSSCAPTRGAAFAPVERMALERTGQHVAWRPSVAQAAKIEELLDAPLTLDAAVKVALINNQNLQAAFESVGLGIAEIADATLADPEVDAQLQFPQTGGGATVELDVTQDVLSLLTLSARRGAARSELEAARYQATAAVINLVADVSRAFYDALAAEQVLELRQTVRDSLQVQLELTERIFAAGNTTKLELVQHRAMLGEARIELSRAEVATLNVRERLNELLGISGKQTGWTLDGRLDDPPKEPLALDDLERVAIERSVALATEKARIEAAAARIGVARTASWLPRLGVGVATDRELDGEWSIGPAVTVALPLWNRNAGERVRAHAQLRRAQSRYTANAVEARSRARVVRATLQEARARVLFIKAELLPTRQQVLDETLKHYNAMNATPFEVLAAKREHIAAATDYIESLRDYWKGRAALDQLQMGSSGSSMATIEGDER